MRLGGAVIALVMEHSTDDKSGQSLVEGVASLTANL
jgi:hypothetical protein